MDADPLAHTYLEERVESVQGLPRLTQLTVKSGLLPEEGGVSWGESESWRERERERERGVSTSNLIRAGRIQ